MPGLAVRAALNNVNRDLGLLNLVGNVVMLRPWASAALGYPAGHPRSGGGLRFAIWSPSNCSN